MLYLRQSARMDDGTASPDDVAPPSAAAAAMTGLLESAAALGPALAAGALFRPTQVGDGESTSA